MHEGGQECAERGHSKLPRSGDLRLGRLPAYRRAGRRSPLASSRFWMAHLTVLQRTNLDGFPKAGELIDITGAHALEAMLPSWFGQ